MPDQVSVDVARERNRILRELAMKKKLEFMQSFVGRELEAITLEGGPKPGGCPNALTDNYLQLRLRAAHSPNQWIRVVVESVENGVLIGKPVRLQRSA